MQKATIKDAIVAILEKENKPLSPKEIEEKIIQNGSYVFKSKNPSGVIATEIRRHSMSSSQAKGRSILFQKIEGEKYWLVDKNI
jgi:hypothetical protein